MFSEWCIETIGFVAAVLAVVGVLLNNRRLRGCFVFWMASNAISAGLHVETGLWSLAVRDAVFFVLAIDGWRRWGRAERGGGMVPKGSAGTTTCHEPVEPLTLEQLAVIQAGLEPGTAGPLTIQTCEMMPEYDAAGEPLLLDGVALRKALGTGGLGVWGQLLCHPKTLERLQQAFERAGGSK